MKKYIKPATTDCNASYGIDLLQPNPTVQSDPNSGVDDGLTKQRGETPQEPSGDAWTKGLW